MPRVSKSRSRKPHATHARRAANTADRLLLLRYLAFVRAVVGPSARPAR